ncbi:hypothetical protein [Proteus terrae]|uniref:hypothetical protein n=1 Tax=Proteus terrae TaxID=1574161 RepID=UPI0028710332|nr:hypothetical protein [Proteus terrae]MDR9740614.1 hypothetical protein [Proteus terrae]
MYGSRFNSEFSQFLLKKGITLYYVLGMLSTIKEKELPHAWLLAKSNGNSFYYDPTLQEHHHFDNKGINNFSYDLVSILSIDEIDNWFIDNYPDRKITSSGLPEGNALFPIINQNRQIIKTLG